MPRFEQWVLLGVFVCFSTASLRGQELNVSNDIVHVGPSVHVSADLPHDPHYEMEIAANPEDRNQLVACSMLFPNDSPTAEVVTYSSFDGGKTWKLTLRTQGERNNESWDPDCRYGPGNIAYSLSEGIRPKEPQAYNRIDRSTDGGKTWESPILSVHAERTFLTIDQNPGPQHGWLYLYGMGNDPVNPAIRVGYSPDGGRTVFSQLISMESGFHSVGMGPGVILSDGSLVMPVPVYKPASDDPYGDIKTKRPGAFKVIRAKFQEANWPLKIKSSTVSDWFIERDSNGSFIPRLAVDSTDGPFRDRIYATWEDVTPGRSVVKLSFSSDKGKTWSHPRVINDDVGRPDGNTFNGPDDIHGIVAVNKQGVVGVMWLDRRDHSDNLGWTIRFRASLDGGETFLPSVKVSSEDYDLSRSNVVPLFPGATALKEAPTTNDIGIGWFTFMGGHTMGLAAAADGKFHPLWPANPMGVPQMWTTDIAVAGNTEKNGSAELSKLEDASKLVRLEFLNRTYNLKTYVLDFDLRLENISESKVNGPLKVRVLDVGSYVGGVTVKSGDTMTPAEGMVLDFSSLFTDNVLKPGDVTKTIHVRLDVRGIDPFSQLGKFSSGLTPLAILTTKVLAGSFEKPKKPEGQDEEEKNWPGVGPMTSPLPGLAPMDNDR